MNLMKLRFLMMGTILIILSIALLVKRYSTDDFILTAVGIILLAVGIVWKNTETKKDVPPSNTS
jgi:FtsH-binding integral membrane protein